MKRQHKLLNSLGSRQPKTNQASLKLFLIFYYYSFLVVINPWLFLPPEFSHKLAPYALRILSKLQKNQNFTWHETTFKHLKFKNPLGIAAGLDKNATNINDWVKFGSGFIEVGTVTAQAQKQNLGKVVIRNIKKKSLWNNLGFPNHGSNKILNRVKKQKPVSPLFVNLGKNRNTSNNDAKFELRDLAEKFLDYADGFVINISSPNTKNLRELSKSKYLQPLLFEINKVLLKKSPKPILLIKLSPDIDFNQLRSTIELSCDLKVDGWVLTNTTSNAFLKQQSKFPKLGGVSGQDLKKRSQEMLNETINILGKLKDEKLIVSVGGVMTPEDVIERLSLGANLVQTYSGIVFYGLSFFKDTKDLFFQKSVR